MHKAMILIAVSAALVGAYFIIGARPDAGGSPALKTATIDRGMVRSTVMATGTVEPIVKVLVGSQVSGTVVRWYANFNQHVEQDEVLAELDQDQIKATITQRQAELATAGARAEEAKARFTEASLSLKRIERAYTQNSSSDYELDIARAAEAMAQAAWQAAQAQIIVAEAELQAARIQLEKTIIRAPIDGVIISRDVDAGQTVAASLSAPTLFTIANDLTRMRVNAAVSETDIGQVHEGMSAEFRVDAYPKQRFKGTVSQVRYAETVVENVVTYETLIDVENPELLLRPGMTATIIFEVQRADDVLRVPNSALRFEPTPPQAERATRRWSKPVPGQPIKPRVYRLEGPALTQVELELGITDGSFTQVLSGGLRAGDVVVVGWDLTTGRSSGFNSGRFQ